MSKAFDPDKYLQGKVGSDSEFDPDSYLQSKVAPAKDTTMQAAVRGLGQGVSLGYAPQIGAAIAPVIDKGIEYFTGLRPPKDTYVQRRDENIREEQRLAGSNPIAYGVGNIAGSIATAAVPGAVAGRFMKGAEAGKALATAEQLSRLDKAKALATPIGKAAATGGTLGFVTNPGDTEGVVSPLQTNERISNAQTGALLGGLTQAGAGVVGGAASAAGRGAKSLAETKAFKATGAMLKDFRNVGTKKIKEIGRQLLDDKVVTAGSTPKAVAQRLESLIDDSTKTIANAINKIDEGSSQVSKLKPDQAEKLRASLFRPKEVADRLKKEIIEEYPNTPIEKLQGILDDIDSWFAGKPEVMPISQVQAFKKEMGKHLQKKDFFSKNPTDKVEGALAVRRGLKEGVEKQADTVSELLGGAGGEIKNANRRLGNYLEVSDIAKDRISRDSANNAYSLGDKILTAGGFGLGGLAGSAAGGDLEGIAKGAAIGAITGGASKLGRTYGNSLMAVGFDKAANQLLKIPKLAELAQNNPAAFQTLVQKFMMDNPQYSGETAIQRRLNGL